MDAAFVYDTYVTGKKFVGRQEDIHRFLNLLNSGESVALYGEPGAGKNSLIREAFTQAQFNGLNLHVAHVDLMRARKTEDVLVGFASAVIKAFASSPSEYQDFVDRYLSDTHFVFDQQQYDLNGNVVSINWPVDQVDASKVFALPAAIYEDTLSQNFFRSSLDEKLVVFITQFQNISFAKDQYMLIKELEAALEACERKVSFVFTGSHLNAMRDIFDVQKWFWRSVERFELSPIPVTDIVDNIYRTFQSQGKVLEKDFVINAVQLLRGNMRYVNHLFSIVNSFSRGYVNKGDVDTGFQMLVSIHTPRFFAAVCSLTDFQLSLLRAIMAGEVRFSSSSVIDKYQLNSSANVNRLKDALVKKEVVWFDDKDEPHVIDPLFEYWLAKVYFA